MDLKLGCHGDHREQGLAPWLLAAERAERKKSGAGGQVEQSSLEVDGRGDWEEPSVTSRAPQAAEPEGAEVKLDNVGRSKEKEEPAGPRRGTRERKLNQRLLGLEWVNSM